MVLTSGDRLRSILPKSYPIAIFAGPSMITMCPRGDSHLMYMIDVALTTEFALSSGGAR